MTDPVSSSDAGSTYVPPITRTTFATPTTRALADAMKTPPNATAVQRRWATVDAVNADGTVDIIIDGLLKQKVLYDASYAPSTGEVVFIDVVGPDVVVMGTVAPSLLNPGHRKASVTAVNTTRTRVSLTVDDGTALVNVPALAPYIPHVGDAVHVFSYLGEFVVAGSVSDTRQLSRRATGQIEPSLVVQPGTLALNGQIVSRAAYPQLWAWVQANTLVKANLFTAGDGTTTFGLPDFRGRTLVGAGVFAGVTWDVGTIAGANTLVLATNQMPAHTHSVAVAAHSTHTHSVDVTVPAHGTHDHGVTASSNSTGSHAHHLRTDSWGESGHIHGISTSYMAGVQNHQHAGTAGSLAEAANPNNGAGWQAATFGSTGHFHTIDANTDSSGAHSHTISVDAAAVSAGSHTATVSETAAGPTTHTVTETTVGGTTPVDVRQPSIAVNYVIWT